MVDKRKNRVFERFFRQNNPKKPVDNPSNQPFLHLKHRDINLLLCIWLISSPNSVIFAALFPIRQPNSKKSTKHLENQGV
jgi:hypothetical protein